MFGPFSDPRIATGIGGIFGEASERVRQRRHRSTKREDLGSPARIETSDSDDLIDDFQAAVSGAVESLGREVLEPGTRLEVEFHAEDLRGPQENQWGPDFGVRLHIAAPGFSVTKGVLLQCKRTYRQTSAPAFDELRGRGEEQAEKMLSLTPASFFLLFNGLVGPDLPQWFTQPVQWNPFTSKFSITGMSWLEFWSQAFKGDDPFQMWNTGVAVLPASRVFAESRYQKTHNGLLPTDAKHWLPASLPFGVFMADLVGSCFVGDVREQVVRLVTPPKLRDFANTGIPDFDPTRFPIRRLMDVRVTSSNG